MIKHLALKLAALLVLISLPEFHSAQGASSDIRQQEAVEPLLAKGHSTRSRSALKLSFAAAQAAPGPRACPEGMIFDTMVRQCSPLSEGCKTGETREADGRCSYAPQPPCRPGATILPDPTRCAYTPLSNYECLPREKLNSDGTCSGRTAEYPPCRSDEEQLPNNMCAYDPAKRTVCSSGDRILPDGRCQHPDGTMTYQTGCYANEQALENPPRCAYVRRMPERFGERRPDGCLPREQLLPDGTCGSMQRGGCQSGEQILSTHPLYPNIDGMCGREVRLQGGSTQAFFLDCRPGERPLTLAGICAYLPEPVLRTTGYLPWRARLRRR